MWLRNSPLVLLYLSCCMDTWDWLGVKGLVNSSDAVPDTHEAREVAGSHALSVCFFCWLLYVKRKGFSKDFPKIYKLPRETQPCKEVLYFTGMLF